METESLIKKLSEEMEPATPFAPRALAVWALASMFFLGLFLGILPIRGDIADRLGSPAFLAETTLFLALFFVSSGVAYRGLVPGMMRGGGLALAGAVLALAVGSAFLHETPWRDFAGQWAREMDFYRGRCGPLLLMVGLAEAGMGFWVARRGAPARPALTGALVGVAAGALGLFAMQFICHHENLLHLAVWHFFPAGVLAAAAAGLGRLTLRW